MQKIYLDQASTSFPKAPGTAEAVYRYMTDCGCNVSRGGYAGAYSAEELVYDTRVLLCRLFSCDETYHEVYEDDCYIMLQLPVVLAYIEKTDGIIIHYEDGNNGVMHSTYVFKEQYLDYLKEYCKGINSYLNN